MVRVYAASREVRTQIHDQIKDIRPAGRHFCCINPQAHIDPGLDIPGLGTFSTPLYERDVRALIEHSHRNSPARNFCDASAVKIATFNSEQFQCLHPQWQQQLAEGVSAVCNALNIPFGSRDVQVGSAKLVLDGAGIPFTHSDPASSKTPFAKFAFFLPCQYEGGDIEFGVNRDKAQGILECAAESQWKAKCVAWLEPGWPHEVRAITSGYRVSLVYNLYYHGTIPLLRVITAQPDLSRLRKILSKWRDAAPKDKRLPKFVVIPLEKYIPTTKLCQKSLGPKSQAQLQHITKLARDLDLVCHLAEVKRAMPNVSVASSKRAGPTEVTTLEQIAHLDGIASGGGVAVELSNFVPLDPWPKTRSDEELQHKKGHANVCRDVALIMMPARLRFDFLLETTGKDDMNAYMRKRLREARREPANELIKPMIDRIREMVFDSDPPKDAPYIERVEDVVRTYIARQQHDELSDGIGQRRAMGYFHPQIVNAIGKALRMGLRQNETTFIAIQSCANAILGAYDNLQARWTQLKLFREYAEANGDSACLEWHDNRINVIIEMTLGYRPTTITCLAEIASYRGTSSWFKEKLLPVVHRHSRDTHLLVGFLHHLMVACNKSSFPKATAIETVIEFCPKMLANAWTLDEDAFPMLYKMLLDLGLTDKIKVVFGNIVENDKNCYRSFTNFLFPALRGICAYMRVKRVSPALPEYQQFTRTVLERYISRNFRSEPSMTRDTAGCEKCSNCSELDAFLASQEQESMCLAATEAIAHHIRARLNALRHKIECDVDVVPDPSVEDPGRKRLVLNKGTEAFKRRHASWKERKQKLKTNILLLGPEAFVRALLGNRYQEFVDLQTMTLARDANGQELGVDLYVKAAQTKPAAASIEEPGVDSAETVSINNKEAGIGSPSASSDSAKRKEGPTLDQENVPPKKRPAIEVIDLGSP